MPDRFMMEAERVYVQDDRKTKYALRKLNLINEFEKPDQQPIFQQADKEELSKLHYKPASPRQTESDGQIWSVLNLTQSQIVQSANFAQEIPCQKKRSQKTFSYEDMEESDDDSEYICGGKKRKRLRRMNRDEQARKVDKQRNIFPNIAKKIAKMMFEECKDKTQRYLRKRKIDFTQFEDIYRQLLDSNCSGLALSKFFTYKTDELKQMSRSFVRLFENYLRKTYTIEAIRNGKMDDLETYLGCKNKQLMYFSDYLNT